MRIYPLKSFEASVSEIAADKSISHRFSIFSLLSDQTSFAKNYLLAEDTLNTLEIIKALGAKVTRKNDEVTITPPKIIHSPNCILECGNSGTAMRLMIGFLSAVPGFFVLSGDEYLNKRPMKRICEPLREINAEIYGRDNANLAPLCIVGKELDGFNYESKIASAQVKTAMILAAFRAKNACKFSEISLSRNHSENMLKAMNAPLNISKDELSLEISPLKEPLKPLEITIPNDPSSAFYFALAAIILPNSHIILKNILLNKTRIEAYKVLEKMGAKIIYKKSAADYEDIGDIEVFSSELKGVEVSENIAWLIDEAPALAIAFALAKGKSVLKNAKELRVKECDRIACVVENLRKFNIECNELDDGFEIMGGEPKFASVKSFGDHRIAMSFSILALICGGEIKDTDCINTSFPNFTNILEKIGTKIDY